jgi:hypothetical protein
MESVATHDLLSSQDYELVEDAWEEHGRRTYLHEEDATRGYIAALAKQLRTLGWETDRGKLRSFHHPTTEEIIELEPGGADTPGHLLHHMKPQEE